ncbi:MAG: DCC1-like thiol-disulfide oxidoreductase family protein [Kiritimatiellae bacterium]|nr:DCC1-like thiol-disulfide oxidoreductase family protein [Kiritimatiellia bacterium]
MDELPVILFDGECNLCNATVRFVLRHERRPWCRFAALQSESGRAFLIKGGKSPACLDTFYLWREGVLLERSDAALAVARALRWPWRGAAIFRVLPRAFRDALYNFVARNRFRWFGRHEFCVMPSGAPEDRFLT